VVGVSAGSGVAVSVAACVGIGVGVAVGARVAAGAGLTVAVNVGAGGGVDRGETVAEGLGVGSATTDVAVGKGPQAASTKMLKQRTALSFKDEEFIFPNRLTPAAPFRPPRFRKTSEV